MANLNSRQRRRNAWFAHSNESPTLSIWAKRNEYGTYIKDKPTRNERQLAVAIAHYSYLTPLGKHVGSKPLSHIRKMIKSFISFRKIFDKKFKV